MSLPQTVVEAFRIATHARPDARAVGLAEGSRVQSWAWQAHGRRVRALAVALVERGVQPDDRIGVLVGPVIERQVATLAVLAAGGVVVRLDPDDPPRRIGEVLAATGARRCLVGDVDELDRVPASLEWSLAISGWLDDRRADDTELSAAEQRDHDDPSVFEDRATGVEPHHVAIAVSSDDGAVTELDHAMLVTRGRAALAHLGLEPSGADRVVVAVPAGRVVVDAVATVLHPLSGGALWVHRGRGLAGTLRSIRPRAIVIGRPGSREIRDSAEAVDDVGAPPGLLSAYRRLARAHGFGAHGSRIGAWGFRVLDATTGARVRSAVGLDRAVALVSTDARPRELGALRAVGIPAVGVLASEAAGGIVATVELIGGEFAAAPLPGTTVALDEGRNVFVRLESDGDWLSVAAPSGLARLSAPESRR